MLILSLCYLLLTGIMYYSKKRVSNQENIIYSLLIIAAFLGILLELSCTFLVPVRMQFPITNSIVNRLFLIYILSWVMLFTKYIFAISFDNSKKASLKIKSNSKLVNIIWWGLL
jgi:hypothetical protein